MGVVVGVIGDEWVGATNGVDDGVFYGWTEGNRGDDGRERGRQGHQVGMDMDEDNDYVPRLFKSLLTGPDQALKVDIN